MPLVSFQSAEMIVFVDFVLWGKEFANLLILP